MADAPKVPPIRDILDEAFPPDWSSGEGKVLDNGVTPPFILKVPPVKDILDEAFPPLKVPPVKEILDEAFPKPKPKPPPPTYTIGAEHQGPRRHAACSIKVDGRVITSRLNPYLISVQVIDSMEGGHSECHLEFDDRNAELQIPPDGVSLVVSLGWSGTGPSPLDQGRTSTDSATDKEIGFGSIKKTKEQEIEMPWGGPGLKEVFSGWVSSVESGFGRRGGGRRLWIEATSGNVKGYAKEPASGYWGIGKKTDAPASAAGGAGSTGTGGVGNPATDAMGPPIPLSIVMQDVFGKAGIEVKLSPEMQKINRDYWSLNNESPQAFGQRIAKEIGGIFKIENGIASIVGREEGVNADGKPMSTVEATWGVNLIGWRIKPYAGRPQWGAAAARYFNLHSGVWETIQKTISGDNTFFSGANAIASLIFPVANGTVAAQANTGTETDSKARRGTGWVLLNGEPEVKGGSKVMIIDARPGVDGTYLVTEAEHNYQRGVGYTTRCNVQYPTPNYGAKSWHRDPPKVLTPPAVPEPSGDDPKTFAWMTEEQKEFNRNWFRQRNLPIPGGLTQSTDPSAPGYIEKSGR